MGPAVALAALLAAGVLVVVGGATLLERTVERRADR